MGGPRCSFRQENEPAAMPPPWYSCVCAAGWCTLRRGVIGRNLALGRANRFKDSRQRLMGRCIDLRKGHGDRTSLSLLRASARTAGRAECSAARSRQCPWCPRTAQSAVGRTSAAIRSCRIRLRRRSLPSSPRRDGTPPPRRNRLASAPCNGATAVGPPESGLGPHLIAARRVRVGIRAACQRRHTHLAQSAAPLVQGLQRTG
jgi:hypothetical protein